MTLLAMITMMNRNAKFFFSIYLNRETRRRYIKLKYEQHAFVNYQYPYEKLYEFVNFAKTNERAKVVDLLLQLFAQNIDLMLPLPNDVRRRFLSQKS